MALARAAGMRYVVLTTRHHDGFSMFDTRASEYRITSPESPYRRDIVKLLADACHGAGMHFGMYYSQPDWHHPDAFTPDRHSRYQDYLKAQLTELLSHYGRVDYLFFDGLSPEGSWNAYGGPVLNELARRLQPQIIINDRNGPPSDFDTPEQTIGVFRLDRPWETCMTLGTQWSWKPDDRIKSVAECVSVLARCAGGDGNLLLNVGPMPTGEIEPRQVAVLKGIGAWLEKNGESIYGTRGGPYRPTDEIASTRKGSTVYLHVLNPSARSVKLPALPASILSSTILGGGSVDVRQTGSTFTLTLPQRDHDAARHRRQARARPARRLDSGDRLGSHNVSQRPCGAGIRARSQACRGGCLLLPQLPPRRPEEHANEGKDVVRMGAGEGSQAAVSRTCPAEDPSLGLPDESDPGVMARKVDAAADHGVDAFIFDWYYYDDGPFLEEFPARKLLQDIFSAITIVIVLILSASGAAIAATPLK